MSYIHKIVTFGVLLLFVCTFSKQIKALVITPTETTVIYTIPDNNRDAWNGKPRSGSSILETRIDGFNSTDEPYEFVGNDSDQESAGLQFSVDIPKNSEVINAYLTVKAVTYESPSSTGHLDIHLANIANMQPFKNGFFGGLVEMYPVTAQSIAWNAGNAWPSGSFHQSSDISNFVQAFINNHDYNPGNFIGLIITKGTIESGSYYGWEDFSSGNPATLTIRYITPSVTSTPIQKLGDANGDMLVNGQDYIIWLNHYGTISSAGYLNGDFNTDTQINGIDYIIWLNHYGT